MRLNGAMWLSSAPEPAGKSAEVDRKLTRFGYRVALT
jgi:hypothetical protein